MGNVQKPVLSFYTNMPTPYQLDFFDALKNYFVLKVIYFTTRENDRQWELNPGGKDYEVKVLTNNGLAKIVQKKIGSFHFSNEIFSVLRNENADFVLVNGTYWSPNVIIAILKAYGNKKRVCFWGEPIFPANNRIKIAIKKLLLWPVRKRTDFLLAIGKRAVESYKHYGYKKNIYNIPYSINTELFSPARLDNKILQVLINNYKPDKEIVFLSSGSLIYRKGMDTVINAFKLLPKDFKVKLIILGDGPEKENLAAMAVNDERIYFVGFQEKDMIPYWFNLADIFVFASRYDGWGLIINEAVAASLPIICSKEVGAAEDKLINNYNAVLADPGDVSGFEQAMRKLFLENEFRDELIKNGKKIKAEFSSEFCAKKLYEIYSV